MPILFNNIHELRHGFYTYFSIVDNNAEGGSATERFTVRIDSLFPSFSLPSLPNFGRNEAPPFGTTSADRLQVQQTPHAGAYAPYRHFEIAGTEPIVEHETTATEGQTFRHQTICDRIVDLYDAIVNINAANSEWQYAKAVFLIKREIHQISTILETHYTNPVSPDRLSLVHYLETLTTFVANAEAILPAPTTTAPHEHSVNAPDASREIEVLSAPPSLFLPPFIYESIFLELEQACTEALSYLNELSPEQCGQKSLSEISAQVTLIRGTFDEERNTEDRKAQLYGLLRVLGLACLDQQLPRAILAQLFEQFTTLTHHLHAHEQSYGTV